MNLEEELSTLLDKVVTEDNLIRVSSNELYIYFRTKDLVIGLFLPCANSLPHVGYSPVSRDAGLRYDDFKIIHLSEKKVSPLYKRARKIYRKVDKEMLEKNNRDNMETCCNLLRKNSVQ